MDNEFYIHWGVEHLDRLGLRDTKSESPGPASRIQSTEHKAAGIQGIQRN